MQRAASKSFSFVLVVLLITSLIALFVHPAAAHAVPEESTQTQETASAELGTLAAFKLELVNATLTDLTLDPSAIEEGTQFEAKAIIPAGSKIGFWMHTNLTYVSEPSPDTIIYEMGDADAKLEPFFIPDYQLTANSVNLADPTDLIINFNDKVSTSWSWGEVSFMQLTPTTSAYGQVFDATNSAVVYDNSGSQTLLTIPAALFSQHQGNNPLTAGTYRAKITLTVGAHVFEYFADFTLTSNSPVNPTDPATPATPASALPKTGNSALVSLGIIAGIGVALLCIGLSRYRRAHNN